MNKIILAQAINFVCNILPFAVVGLVLIGLGLMAGIWQSIQFILFVGILVSFTLCMCWGMDHYKDSHGIKRLLSGIGYYFPAWGPVLFADCIGYAIKGLFGIIGMIVIQSSVIGLVALNNWASTYLMNQCSRREFQ